MTSILITSILSFMLGSLFGSERDNIYNSLTLIPIEAGEPRLNSRCLIQTKEYGDHLLLAEYADDGWTLTDYPGIKVFTVAAWCYSPEPIRR